MAPHTDICKLATPSHASARLNKQHMVSMGSLPARVGGGAVGASRGNAATWPGARPSGNCGAEKPEACRGEPGRREGLELRRYVREPAPLPPAPAAPPLSARSLPARQRGPDHGCYRRAQGHSADRDDPQTLPTADVAGTARGEQNPSGAQVIPSPASPEIAAESVARGIAVAAIAYSDLRAHLDDAEESGAGGSDGAREIAGLPLRDEEGYGAQENGDEEIAAAETDAAGNARTPDSAVRRGGSTRPYPGPTSTPARWAAGPPEEAGTAHAQSGDRAHSRRDGRGDVYKDQQAPAPAGRSPPYPPAQDRDQWLDPLRPMPRLPTPALRQRESDVAADPQHDARGPQELGTHGESAWDVAPTAADMGAVPRTREEAQVALPEQHSGPCGGELGREEWHSGSSNPSTDGDETTPAQGAGEIPTGGRTASAIQTPRNRAATGNRAATNARVTTTPDTPAPIISADDLAGRQDLFADIANWDLCPLRDSRQPPLARHPPRPLRESFAICLLTPLLHLAKNPDSSSGWKLLLFLPRILLRSSSARKPDWRGMGNRLTRFRQGLWRNLYNEAADAVANSPQPRHVPDTTGKLARAEGLAKRGNLAKSLQSLTATPVCIPSAEVLSALMVRHPEASRAIPAWVHDFASENVPSITARDFRRLLAKCPNGGGTRPIAVGECLLRLIAKAALFLAAPAVREHFTPLQFGVAIAGGIEAAIHSARTYLEEFPGATALQIDLATAFNAVERAAVFEGLKGTALDPLVPLARLSYSRPSALYLDHDFGALPLGEWSAWGEGLLHTYLAAAHTKIPRDRAERVRIWQQAALPASLGGLGITNPAVEGGFAYLASVVSAAHLLRSFGDSANPAHTPSVHPHLVGKGGPPGEGFPFPEPTTPRLGGGRIATHHALRDECAKIAAEAGFTVHKETTAYSPVDNLKADISIRHPDTGEVWICDITVTDPVSHQDEQARKAPGWAARMQADKKESKYTGRSAWVGFYAMAVETYGYPSPGVLDFIRSCAELAGKRWFNAAPKSREVAKLLTEYRQRWSVTLQRAQANALRVKTHEALTADVLGLQGPLTPLSEGQLYQLIEDPSGY
ncbi:unnamed protein product [Closterium sp. NIES-53]